MKATTIRHSIQLCATFKNKHFVRRSALLALFIAAALVSACEGSPSDQDYLQSANDAFLKGDYRVSLIATKNALKDNPENANARLLLARIYIETGQGKAALEQLERAGDLGITRSTLAVPLGRAYLLTRHHDKLLAIHPESENIGEEDRAHLHALRGYAYIAKKNAADARDEFDSALSLQPGLVLAALGHVRLSLAQRNLTDAENRIATLQKDFANEADVHALAGEIALIKKDTETAERAFTSALEINPENSGFLEKRALIRLSQNRLEAATEDLDALLGLAPAHPRVLYVQGLHQYMSGTYADAKTTLEKLLNKDTQHLPGTFLLGLANVALGNEQQALVNLERYIAHVPHSLPAGSTLAALYVKRRQFEQADSLLQSLRKAHPANSTVMGLLAESNIRQGRTDEALVLLEMAQQLQPDSAELQASLGFTLVRKGKADEAIGVFDNLLGNKPNSEQALRGIALAHLGRGDLDAALKSAKDLVQQHPPSAAAHTLLGSLYIAKGDNQHAETEFNAALTQTPGYPAASHSLALLAQRAGNVAKAKEYYSNALAHHPQDTATLIRIALVEQSTGATESAEQHLLRALEIDAGNLIARLHLAKSYLQRRAVNDARALLGEAPPAIREEPALLAQYAKVLALNGETGNAIDTLRRLVTIQPTLTAAWVQLGKLYEQSGDLTQAQTAFQQAIRSDSQDILSAAEAIRGSYRVGQHTNAAKQYATLANAHPNDVNVKLLGGWLKLQAEKYDEAIDTYEHIHADNPSSASILMLVDAKAKAGQIPEATTALQAWVTQHPQDKPASIGLGQLYLEQKRVAEAAQTLEKLLSHHPKDTGLLNDLAWLLSSSNPSAALVYAEQAYRLDSSAPTILDTMGTLVLEKGETARSVDLLTRAVEGNPHNPSIRFHLAQALSADRQPARAKAELNVLLKENKTFPERDAAEALSTRLRTN